MLGDDLFISALAAQTLFVGLALYPLFALHAFHERMNSGPPKMRKFPHSFTAPFGGKPFASQPKPDPTPRHPRQWADGVVLPDS